MKKKDTITINKKILPGIFCLLPLTAILISRREMGPLVLLIIGVSCGIYIGFNWKR